ncbi:MAG: hypothetical protein KDI38_18180 [Calditrichaeota bacterium]|nr:hypothetical protein [Calditrichota bacterium]MCB0313879.1 hypothetical protein [Calditrichota bacterium]MCB9087300.1 hypothetical protein [Calditrichia bacterium]
MARYIAFWIWLFPLLAGAAAQDTVVGAPAEVPWDTLMAEIQVIESLEEADSLKDGQMKALFARYQVGSEDYRRFYEQFLQRTPDAQQQFIQNVKSILQALTQANREAAVKELKLDRPASLPRKP